VVEVAAEVVAEAMAEVVAAIGYGRSAKGR